MSSPEQLRQTGPEIATGQEAAAGERLKQLQEQLEKNAESNTESKQERVSEAKAETEQVFSREAGKERKGPTDSLEPTTVHASKQQRKASYKRTMKHIQTEMNTPQRAFSRFVHNPVIEAASDLSAKTVARPNAILSGAICATVLSLVIYFVAKFYGYPLSGSESIASFVIGWLLGLLYDAARLFIAKLH